jgi:CubicO group peptidase (beta-lactamase class C family)
MNKKLLLFSCLLITCSHMYSQKKATADKRLAGVDTTINNLLRDWHAAGCAIAIVEKNKVLFAKGFGYKDYEKKIPATENTIFAIGSCSKAFTSSLLGMLEKDGKLELDKPVQEYLPELKFHNETLTNHVTARDMMSHRTGLPRHDYSWYGSSTTRDSLIYRIRFLEPSAELRQRWQYNNFMFLAQGALAEKLYGKKWEQLVKEKILDPLGMTRSNFSVTDLQKDADFTYGYKEQKDSVVRMDYMNIDPIGPAGSINSSAKEMANWAIAWINGGKLNGKEVIPASYVAQAISPQMVVGGLPSSEMPDIFGSDYGLGWFIQSYRGHYLVHHGGNIDGFSAMTAFFPTDSIGIVVLVNQNGSPLPYLIRNIIADKMLGLKYRNWSKLQKDAIAKNKTMNKDKQNVDSLNQKKNTKPSHPLSDYAGAFENPGYGTIQIRLNKDTLWADYNNSQGKIFLKHYHYDVFNIESTANNEDQPKSKLRFNTDNKGEISSLEIPFEPSVKDIEFTRLPPAIAIAKSDLQMYVGDYQLGGIVVKVYIRGENTLMVLVPGQPDYELVPSKKHEFDLKILKGYSVKFDVSDKNVASALSFIQPNGVFKATRK